ncbi:MAG: hypothetical protein VB855_17755, partial [Pirellulaceae bacterium]
EELDGSLEQFTNLIRANYGDALILLEEQVEIGGIPAVKMKFSQSIDGVHFTYVNYLLKNGDFFYQILGWGMTSDFPEVAADIDGIAGSFVIARERLPRSRRRNSIKDDYGHDWRITDNVYFNASFGFRLDPAAGLRLMGREELLGVNGDADAGFSSDSPTTYHIYLIEKSSAKEVVNSQIANWENEMGLSPDAAETTSVICSGQNAEQRIYRDVIFEGFAVDYSWTYFFRQGVLYRLLSWWPADERSEAATVLEDSLNQFSWLNQDERDELQKQMSSLDANNAVGLDYSHRNGVFRDFTGGYTYTMPSGFWKALTGDTLLAENPDARLAIEHFGEGIYVQLIPEQGLELTADEYHQALLANLDAGEEVTTREIKVGDQNIKVSSFDENVGDVVITYRMASVIRDQRYVKILIYALKDNESQLSKRFPEIVGGLNFPDAVPQVVEWGPGDIKDQRLGFQLSYNSGWEVNSESIPSLESAANMLIVTHRNGAYMAMAICAPLTSFAEDMMIDGLMRESEIIKVDPATRVESDTTLDGRPARRVSFAGLINGTKARAVVWITRRGNTAYMLLAVGEDGVDLESRKQRFSLLD